MSTAIGLADLIEDEILLEEQLPLHLELQDILVTLIEDRPPSNITSPGPIPLKFSLDRLNVYRGTDGEFKVSPRIEPLNPAPSLDEQELKRLRTECSSLRARLGVLERAADEVRKLRRSRDEADALRTSLASAQADIARLLEDKRKLLDELRNMRDMMHGVQQVTQNVPQQNASNKR